MMWQRMDQVPNDVEVVNIYGETLIGSFVTYGRDVQQAEREQYAGPFMEVGLALPQLTALPADPKGPQ